MNSTAPFTVQTAAIAASSPPESAESPEFHVAVTAQPGLIDWNGIHTSLAHLLSNKVGQGHRITVHGLTRSAGTHLATLWAIGQGHSVTHARRSPQVLNGLDQTVLRLHAEHPDMPLIIKASEIPLPSGMGRKGGWRCCASTLLGCTYSSLVIYSLYEADCAGETSTHTRTSRRVAPNAAGVE